MSALLCVCVCTTACVMNAKFAYESNAKNHEVLTKDRTGLLQIKHDLTHAIMKESNYKIKIGHEKLWIIEIQKMTKYVSAKTYRLAPV